MSTTPLALRPTGHPVLRVQLRTRLRGTIGQALLLGWVIGIVAVAIAVLLHQVGTDQPMRRSGADAVVAGRALGQWWVIACTVGMAALGPAAAAGAFAGARERHNLVPWQVSLLRPRHLVGGHLCSLAAFLALAAVAVAPVGVLARALGGVTAPELAVGLAGAWATGLVCGCVALAVSAFARRTTVSLLVSVIVVTAVLGGTAVAHSAGADRTDPGQPDPVMLANPVVATADAVRSLTPPARAGREDHDPRLDASNTPLRALRSTVRADAHRAGGLAPWVTTGLGGAAVALVALLVATWRLGREKPEAP